MNVSELKVLNVWRFTIRRLVICDSDKTSFVMQLASKVTTEREAVYLIRQRFTHEWWDEVLIQEVELVGEIHMIENVPLYEG